MTKFGKHKIYRYPMMFMAILLMLAATIAGVSAAIPLSYVTLCDDDTIEQFESSCKDNGNNRDMTYTDCFCNSDQNFISCKNVYHDDGFCKSQNNAPTCSNKGKNVGGLICDSYGNVGQKYVTDECKTSTKTVRYCNSGCDNGACVDKPAGLESVGASCYPDNKRLCTDSFEDSQGNLLCDITDIINCGTSGCNNGKCNDDTGGGKTEQSPSIVDLDAVITSYKIPAQVVVGETFTVQASVNAGVKGSYLVVVEQKRTGNLPFAITTSKNVCDGDTHNVNAWFDSNDKPLETFFFNVEPYEKGVGEISVEVWTDCYKNGGKRITTTGKQIIAYVEDPGDDVIPTDTPVIVNDKGDYDADLGRTKGFFEQNAVPIYIISFIVGAFAIVIIVMAIRKRK